MSSTAPLYDLGVTVTLQALENLLIFTKKAEKWAGENNVSLIDGKIADDMNALPFQIQSACDAAKFIPVRAGGVENVAKENNETTLAQLYERIEFTIEFLKKVKPEDLQGKEDKEVIVKAGPNEIKFTGLTYLQDFALPNFFFHHVMAYAILRKLGAPVGKFDYLDGKGEIQARMVKK